MNTPCILIVDDEEYSRRVIKRLLGRKGGYRILTADSGYEAIDRCQKEKIDLVLLDQRMPGITGLETMKAIKEMNPYTAVIMMTGFATVEEAVKAMKIGAYSYLTKPFDNLEEIEIVVEKALMEKALMDENQYLKNQLNMDFSFEGIIGKSKGIQRVIDLVKKVAPLDSTILIYGDTGTGKELIARTIHQNSSRTRKKFVAVNCGAVPESLLESCLFGYEKGAFTGAVKTTAGYFEEAHGGTIFLDEITNTNFKFQAALLRVLQEKEFSRIGDTAKIKTDFRLIVAANCSIEDEIKNGRFREDLYYRINVIPITIPPLKERKEDIPILVNYFLEKFNKQHGKNVGPVSIESMTILEENEWKGNVREIRNTIERIVALKGEGKIDASDLPANILVSKSGVSSTSPSYSELPYQTAKEKFEREYITDLLIQTNNNITRVAQKSGILRQNLYQKLKKYGMK